ncbi:hypothetical protein V6N12_065134 [Hibiscus sabdariffa]|uniref:Reverse transcriptase zinc-binding domain-containing protein n=1 Tax=Hibiscus sabdariffa TaxID=183260 RepID=A0ABR2G7U2_9ROSI
MFANVDAREEHIRWEGHSSGVSNTRTGYNWIKRQNATYGQLEKILTTIRNLCMLLKIKIFTWKLCHKALARGNRLLNECLGDEICKLCEKTVETVVHAFHDCPLAKEVLEMSGYPTAIINDTTLSVKEWLINDADILATNEFEGLIVLLWSVWNQRNTKVTGLRRRDKLLFGGNLQRVRLTKHLNGSYNAGLAEATTFHEGIQLVIDMNWTDAQVEGDAINIVNRLANSTLDMSTLGVQTEKDRQTLRNFKDIKIMYVSRIVNSS